MTTRWPAQKARYNFKTIPVFPRNAPTHLCQNDGKWTNEYVRYSYLFIFSVFL